MNAAIPETALDIIQSCDNNRLKFGVLLVSGVTLLLLLWAVWHEELLQIGAGVLNSEGDKQRDEVRQQ